MFFQAKKTCLSITKDILLNITRTKPTFFQDLNINIAFKVVWAGFLHMSKFSYTKADLKNHKGFSVTKLIRLDIIFLQDDQYVVLRLKKSKTDIKDKRVEIIIAAINDASYPVLALCQLFMLDLQPSNAPLFKLDNRAAFRRRPVIQIPCQRLEASGIPY